MMPILNIFGSGNLTNTQIDNLFSPLRAGLKIQNLSLIIGLSLGGAMIIVLIVLIINCKKLKKKVYINPEDDNLTSLQARPLYEN